MTPFLFSFVFGALENFTKILAAFLLFRFGFRQTYIPVLIVSCMISLSDIGTISVMKLPFWFVESIDLFIVTISFIFLMRLPFWYSVILSFSAWIYGTVIQAGVAMFLVETGIFTMKQIIEHFVATSTVQMMGALLCSWISWCLYRKGYGFVFMSEKVEIQDRGNLVMISSIVACIAFFEYAIYIGSLGHPYIEMISLGLSLASLSALIIYNKTKKDWKHYYLNRNTKDFHL